jgi:hypothetical protein
MTDVVFFVIFQADLQRYSIVYSPWGEVIQSKTGK